MKWLCLLILAAMAMPQAGAIQKQYQPGKIISVQQKARTRVLYYLVNTPVTQDDPYYEVTVQLQGTLYVGEYTPRHAADALPEDWAAGTDVQARAEKRHLYVKGVSGQEIDFIVVKHSVASVNPSPEAAPPKN